MYVNFQMVKGLSTFKHSVMQLPLCRLPDFLFLLFFFFLLLLSFLYYVYMLFLIYVRFFDYAIATAVMFMESCGESAQAHWGLDMLDDSM